MICTGHQGQSALEFYLTLRSRTDIAQCRGPLVYLELNENAATVLLEATKTLKLENSFSNTFIAVSVEGRALFGSCVSHWLDIIYAVNILGETSSRQDLIYVSNLLMLRVCSTLNWDARELSNYLLSFSYGQERK